MSGPSRARFLGLWTAAWLAVLLVLGMLRFGDPAVQWPVLLVPALWALVALRPRRGPRPAGARPERRPRRASRADEDDPGRYEDRYEDPYEEQPPLPPGMRTDTVERPALRRQHGEDDRW
ncbi:hypothetical protein DQ237_15795 [Blastococcus sp. TF02-8]|uniref:hypothetical protein n=1 Tax=Blastococcus sp. TF02-8 TaxID=2250574 RepID=UPI000DE8DF7E|nr:hypothetical protein [Blastococcus sp. TF02-8]RBY95153.1 hypothetical protein DQ237_15795 [Blastococcus sp. TF02-8]